MCLENAAAFATWARPTFAASVWWGTLFPGKSHRFALNKIKAHFGSILIVWALVSSEKQRVVKRLCCTSPTIIAILLQHGREEHVF